MGAPDLKFWLFKDGSSTAPIVRMFSVDPEPLGLVNGKRKTTATIPSGAPLATMLSQLNVLLAELSGFAGEETFIEVRMEPIDPVRPPG